MCESLTNHHAIVAKQLTQLLSFPVSVWAHKPLGPAQEKVKTNWRNATKPTHRSTSSIPVSVAIASLAYRTSLLPVWPWVTLNNINSDLSPTLHPKSKPRRFTAVITVHMLSTQFDCRKSLDLQHLIVTIADVERTIIISADIMHFR